jgi:hypothetical protein
MTDSRYFVIKHLPARCPRLTLLDSASPLGRLSHHWSAVTDPRQLEDALQQPAKPAAVKKD